MLKSRVWSLLSLSLLAVLSGCVTAHSPAPVLSGPLFQPTAEDSAQLALVRSDLNTIGMECAAEHTCEDRVHFARAIVNLFENREAARASFEQLLSRYPSSPLAASSALWLQLLTVDDMGVPLDDPQHRILMALTAQSAREWLARLRIKDQAETEGPPQAGIVQALSKQIQDRERHIAKLRAQLDALKVIDEDQRNRHRKIRTPASLIPNGEIRP